MALEALGLPLHPDLRVAASLVLLALGLGLALPVVAWWHGGRVEMAMRTGQPLPAPHLGLPLALGVLVVGVLVSLGVLIGSGS